MNLFVHAFYCCHIPQLNITSNELTLGLYLFYSPCTANAYVTPFYICGTKNKLVAHHIISTCNKPTLLNTF